MQSVDESPAEVRGRPYGGVAAPERLALRRDKFVSAAVELLNTEGISGLSLRAVTERAGVSRRFFYESFDNLDALLVCVFDELVASLAATALEAVSSAPDHVEAKIRAAITAFMRRVEAQPAQFNATFVEGTRTPPLRERLAEAQAVFRELIKAQARDFYGLGSEDEADLDFTSRMLVSGSVETISAWLEGRIDLTADQLSDRFTSHYVDVAEALVSRLQTPTRRR